MGSYVKNNLMKDESIVYEAKLHWFYWVGPIILILFLFYICHSFLYEYDYTYFVGENLRYLVPPACVIAIIVVIIVKFVNFFSLEMVLTNKRLIIKTGFVSRNTFEIQLSQIETMGLDQSVFGRVFSYGSISVKGTGGTLRTISKVANPLSFRNAFFEEKEKSKCWFNKEQVSKKV